MSVEIQKKTGIKIAAVIITVLVLVVTLAIGATQRLSGENMFAGTRPTNIGIQSEKLAACPGTPNCVNSQSLDAQSKIAPIAYNSTPTEAMTKLKTVIGDMERTKIITETNNYLYAEFTSKLMGFVDDVEFLLDDNAKVIQVRSASRLGQSDLGVNRKRIEEIRTKLNELQA
ncbi:MAG: DUF1499 domain-containing protein [Coleofasciculaceae cyanobacterium]